MQLVYCNERDDGLGLVEAVRSVYPLTVHFCGPSSVREGMFTHPRLDQKLVSGLVRDAKVVVSGSRRFCADVVDWVDGDVVVLGDTL